MTVRFVIIGGGPAGNTAATRAASFGAEVTVIERDIIGGAAHLWDCIPSKAMIATGGALAAVRRAPEMGLTPGPVGVDAMALRQRIEVISEKIEHDTRQLLESQGVRILRGSGCLVGPHQVVATTADGPIDSKPMPFFSPPGVVRVFPIGPRWTVTGCSPPGTPIRPGSGPSTSW